MFVHHGEMSGDSGEAEQGTRRGTVPNGAPAWSLGLVAGGPGTLAVCPGARGEGLDRPAPNVLSGVVVRAVVDACSSPPPSFLVLLPLGLEIAVLLTLGLQIVTLLTSGAGNSSPSPFRGLKQQCFSLWGCRQRRFSLQTAVLLPLELQTAALLPLELQTAVLLPLELQTATLLPLELQTATLLLPAPTFGAAALALLAPDRSLLSCLHLLFFST
ncbi:UNVERIFIED_CONTAM: hypothetical protein FKN15_056811 [Acipenser sinensis]